MEFHWRIWNPESSYNSEEKAFGIILSSFVGTPPFRTWTPPGSSRRKIYTTQAEGNFSSSFYCSRSTNIILDSLSKYYVFFRNMRIFLLLGTQKPDRPKRELGCLYKKPGRIPNPCRRIPNPPVSVLFSIRTFYEKGLEPEFFNTVRTFMFRLFGLPEFMPCAFHCDERGRRRFPVSSY